MEAFFDVADDVSKDKVQKREIKRALKNEQKIHEVSLSRGYQGLLDSVFLLVGNPTCFNFNRKSPLRSLDCDVARISVLFQEYLTGR